MINSRKRSGSGMFAGVALLGTLTILVSTSPASAQRLSGSVKMDGSSTVAPVMTAAAELFRAEQPRVRATVGISGTGGGFKKFLSDRENLRTDINNASRAIKGVEIERAGKLGIGFIEIPIGLDGIAVMVNPANTFCHDLTVDELKRMWEPESEIKSWKDIRPGFPDVPLKLYGPDTDSGTFDFFTKAIVGKERACRSDYTASTSDNVLVQGIAGDQGALGYFGFSYYEANKSKLKLIGVDNNNGTPLKPDLKVISSGNYKPLSRPLLIYVNASACDRTEVTTFLDFFFDNAKMIVEHPRVNYVALQEELYDIGRKRIRNRITGSAVAKSDSADLMTIFSTN